ncbi:MAG: hypothetical protein ACXVDN_09560 [Ktedonobacteraceae bacterium]
MATRINELCDLFSGQRLGQPPLTFGGDDPRVLWFCFGNAVQEWFVPASIGHGQSIQGEFGQGLETDVKVVEEAGQLRNIDVRPAEVDIT